MFRVAYLPEALALGALGLELVRVRVLARAQELGSAPVWRRKHPQTKK
ncbi:MAG: hypothetical protein V1771_04100 [Chloroflexota bacterium]